MGRDIAWIRDSVNDDEIIVVKNIKIKQVQRSVLVLFWLKLFCYGFAYFDG